MNAITEYLNQYFDELEPKEFYRVIFPEGELDQRDAMTKGKYTGIIIEVTDKKKKVTKTYKDGTTKEVEVPVVYRHSITDSLEEIDMVLESGNFCLAPPLSYAGKERKSENARFLYAIAVDLDEIIYKGDKPQGLYNMFSQIDRAEFLPRPTMMVSSGTGLHLYYVFEQPIPLFPNVARELQKYKHRLTQMCWNEGITTVKNDNDIQYEGIYQGFRMPGTITKQGKKNGTNERARCFLTGQKVTVEYMNGFVEEKYQIKEVTYKSKYTKAQAKELYPDWYEKRIVDGYKGVLNPWSLNRNVYDWWLRTLKSGAKVGHRYWCLWILAIYAKKCSFYDEEKNPNPVTREELERDAWELLDYLDEMTETEDNHFTEVDVIEALEAFEDDFISYPRNSIKYKSAIPFEPSVPRREKGKRLKQPEHIKVMNYVRDEVRKMNNWREGNGRPKGAGTKEELVREYAAAHPETNVTEIARALGVSRTTVYKYLGEKTMEKKKKIPQVDYIYRAEDGTEILIETDKLERIEAEKLRLREYFMEITKGGKK
ncbi:MAG: hypothetical protein IJV81_09590 [Paludibacteraceae bacterium]|nr:hypothetical protein [Paludibacteraceae bacterium]